MSELINRYSGFTVSRKAADRIFYGTTACIHLANCLVSRGDLFYVIPATFFLGFGYWLWSRLF